MSNKSFSIIEVTVNGLTSLQCVADVVARMESVEKSALNMAVLCAYATGVTIPVYTTSDGVTHGQAICDKPMSRKEFIGQVGRSKATISRWLKALSLIIDNGDFARFADGSLPFSFDKVIFIYEHDIKMNKSNMGLSLDKLVEKYAPKDGDGDDATTDDATTTTDGATGDNGDGANTSLATLKDDDEIVFTMFGMTYSTTKKELVKFLNSCTIKLEN